MSLLSIEAVDLLRDLANQLRDYSGDEVGYGFFPGGNPNDFSPDEECSTEEERAAWKAACERYNAGQRGESPQLCGLMERVSGIPNRESFGLGTYTLRCSDVDELANELDRWIDKAREVGDRYR